MLRLTRTPERWGVDPKQRVFPGWLREPEHPSDPGTIRRAANAVADVPREARKQAQMLREVSPKPGRRESLADLNLARCLYSLWCYFRGETAPDNRSAYGRSWPFIDFLRTVARTVRPDFKGEAAARKILAEYTEVRRKLGELN